MVASKASKCLDLVGRHPGCECHSGQQTRKKLCILPMAWHSKIKTRIGQDSVLVFILPAQVFRECDGIRNLERILSIKRYGKGLISGLRRIRKQCFS